MRLLVADDDDAIRRLLVLELRSRGAEVVEAADGEEAVRRALEYRPDGVFLDVLMPRLNGYDALARLRAAGYTGRVVMVTALFEGSRELDSGVRPDDILAKPFRRRDVQACWERFLAALGSSASRSGEGGAQEPAAGS
ncbi:MAG: response regulator [Pseudomonadota bacterium]